MRSEDDQLSRDETIEQLKALGYIDPGAGSSMWQIILAGFFRASSRVKMVLRKLFPAQNSENQED